MSYVCKRGHKCMCFQCGEKDCEHFESETPEWVKDILESEGIKEKLKKISELRPTGEPRGGTGMKGIFIPEITAQMFRDGCLESIEALMAEGQIYDIEYDPKSEEQDIPNRNVGDIIYRQAAIDWLTNEWDGMVTSVFKGIEGLPSAQPERKTGRWINGFCSICGKEAVTEWNDCGGERLETDFCPFCGADMRGDGKND